MALLKLNLEPRQEWSSGVAPSSLPGGSNSSEQHGFRYGGVSLGLFPGRGLLYSFLFHEIAIFSLLLFWPVNRVSPAMDPPKKWELTMIPKEALYLPALGGGDSGGQHQGRSAAKSPSVAALAVAAWSKAGVSYPGAQAIISNPPHPTNRIQTILQPPLPDPPELKEFVSLPNMVKLAETTLTPVPVVAAQAAKADPLNEPQPAHNGPSIPTIPPLQIAAPPTIENPKLVLPTLAPASGPVLQATAGPPAVAPPPKAVAAQVRALPGSSGADHNTLVALSVMPAPPEAKPNVPAAEAHGQFAIVALPNLAMSHLGPGAAVETATPTAVGAGANPNSFAHNAAGTKSMSVGGGAGSAADAGGTLAAGGPGAGAGGSGRGVSGTTGGGLTIKGGAFGSGPGAGGASGAGVGSGPAPGGFAGMTIQGGEWPNGMPAGVAAHPAASPPDPGTYGLTIISTASSGGGLGDFGVFYDEPVFTVYIRMATETDLTAPSWTLEFAALHAGEGGGAKIAPPFPTKRQSPDWPVELVDRYRNQLLVIYVVIDEQGKLEHAKSMQSPNIRFNAPLMAALSEWEFRPATVDGRPIAVRALLGVPIFASATPAPPAAHSAESVVGR